MMQQYHVPYVVRIRRKGGNVVVGCDVYIGRRLTMAGWDLADSYWRNEFEVAKYGRDGAIAQYEISIRQRLAADRNGLQYLINIISAGRPLSLGCWCKDKPDIPCHGDVIVKLAKELIASLSQQSHIVSVQNQAIPNP